VLAVDSELRSGSWKSWGAAPIDGESPTASSRSLDGCQLRLHFKATVRWDFSGSQWGSSSSVAVAGDEEDDRRGFAKDPGASLYFFLFLGSFV
jgi:hypothetical protein